MKKNIYHKYHAKPTMLDGERYDSKKEAQYAAQLKLRKASGEILFYLRQVPFRLPGNVRYVVDFVEFHAPKDDDQGEVVFTDVKGMMTPMAKNKIAQVAEIYGVEINII